MKRVRFLKRIPTPSPTRSLTVTRARCPTRRFRTDVTYGRIWIFFNPQLFLCGFGFRPHVGGVLIRHSNPRLFESALHRVESFEYATIRNRVDAKSGYSRTPLFRTRLIRSPCYFEGRSNSLGFTLMFSVIYYQLFRTRLFRIPRYFELIVLSLHLKSTPLFRTCRKTEYVHKSTAGNVLHFI